LEQPCALIPDAGRHINTIMPMMMYKQPLPNVSSSFASIPFFINAKHGRLDRAPQDAWKKTIKNGAEREEKRRCRRIIFLIALYFEILLHPWLLPFSASFIVMQDQKLFPDVEIPLCRLTPLKLPNACLSHTFNTALPKPEFVFTFLRYDGGCMLVRNGILYGKPAD